jgi:hypothetical protein
LSYKELEATFGHLMSQRQLGSFLQALEDVQLALPADRSVVPNVPRRLSVSNMEEAVEVLQYHPEVAFHEEGTALVFGPGT